jgi:hypothetical protein
MSSSEFEALMSILEDMRAEVRALPCRTIPARCVQTPRPRTGLPKWAVTLAVGVATALCSGYLVRHFTWTPYASPSEAATK